MNIFQHIKYLITGIHPNPPPRPEPIEVDIGKIIATVHFNNSDEVIVKQFEGLCCAKYQWSEIHEEWDYFPLMAETRFKNWRDIYLFDGKFVSIGDKQYPISQISYIDVQRESKIITVK